MARVEPVTRFGRQRPARDVAALALLFSGFSGLMVAIWLFYGTWVGALLPAGFLVSLYAGLRVEVREIELQQQSLIIRTFFRSYPIPREHITAVHPTPRGPAIEVLNGSHYIVTPIGIDPAECQEAVLRWWNA